MNLYLIRLMSGEHIYIKADTVFREGPTLVCKRGDDMVGLFRYGVVAGYELLEDQFSVRPQIIAETFHDHIKLGFDNIRAALKLLGPKADTECMRQANVRLVQAFELIELALSKHS